jgi:hypothetical protein
VITIDVLRGFSQDFVSFAESIFIPAVGGPARFGDVMADFQRERFRALEPSLCAVKDGRKPLIGRFWWEATKGASKDSDLAVALLWLLAFTHRPLTCQVGAADADQAQELRKAALAILRLNNWLGKAIEVQARKIIAPRTGSEAEIIPADVAGSHGARPDVLIANELSHVAKREFIENLADNATKVPHGIMVIATNAGFLDSWQAEWRQIAMDSDRWSVHVWGQPAPWLDEADLAEASKRNSPSRYNRLFWGRWSSGEGDALSEDDIQAAIVHAGPMSGSEDYIFGAGLDLGIRRDHSGFVVVGVRPSEGKVRLAWAEQWKPPKGGEVSAATVRAAVIQANIRFRLNRCYYDPSAGGSILAQDLRNAGVNMLRWDFTSQNCDLMAREMMLAFRERRIQLYDHPDLIRDLRKLNIVDRGFKLKLDAPRDEFGHSDVATALAIIMPVALATALEPPAPPEPEYRQVFADGWPGQDGWQVIPKP